MTVSASVDGIEVVCSAPEVVDCSASEEADCSASEEVVSSTGAVDSSVSVS